MEWFFGLAVGEEVQLGGCCAMGGWNRASQIGNECRVKQPGNNLQIGDRGGSKGGAKQPPGTGERGARGQRFDRLTTNGDRGREGNHKGCPYEGERGRGRARAVGGHGPMVGDGGVRG